MSLHGGWDSLLYECHFQLHNIGLGFCADCQEEGDILGCTMMLAPCSDDRQQQVGGQSSQNNGQGRPASGFSMNAPQFFWGHLLLVVPYPLMAYSFPTVMTHSSPVHSAPRCKHRHRPSSEYEHLSSREMERLFSQCLHMTDEETEA